jgi:hypothetical protein
MNTGLSGIARLIRSVPWGARWYNPPGVKVMRIETERWWRQAEQDLVTARVTLAGERWSATFFAQQVAEKARQSAAGGPRD